MQARFEEKIIQHALAMGLLVPEVLEQLDRLSPPPLDLTARYGNRLALLIHHHYLPRQWVDETLEIFRVQARSDISADHKKAEAFPTLTAVPGRAPEQWKDLDVAFTPFKNWDRYEVLDFIGHGGMGYVLKARDPRLNRLVALKILTDDRPEQIRRFLQEARAQAQINHPNVCRIYEVGTFETYHYIAMQYIDGYALTDLMTTLPLETRLQLMCDVALAVHEAHRLGLIHRDIKPSNIMVERKDDGGWHPYILDFGLARPVHEPGMTATGAILGTPYYMAPEQATGEPHRVDRRTDVYGLGATLYHLVCGEPPFATNQGFEVLMAVLHDEPIPPRKIRPDLPHDLETIILTAMDRDPHRRYPTARALAEDLARYLNGDPILARPPSLWYRFAKKYRKNLAFSLTITLSSVLLLVLLAMTIHTRITAREQARLAQQFGELLQEAEGVMRTGYLMPLHNIHKEKTMVQKRVQVIYDKVRHLPNYAVGPAMTALGRLFLLLNDPQNAIEHLKKAEKTGYVTPQLNLAMGLALSQLYHFELTRAHRIADAKTRQMVIKKAALHYRIPALHRLREVSLSEPYSRSYIQALIHFVEEDYDRALKIVERAIREEPWPYPSLHLKANILKEIASQFKMNGAYKKAFGYYRNAEEVYRQAARIARSYSPIYLDWCELYINIIDMDLWNVGQDPTPAFRQARDTCQKAIKADPESMEAYLFLARGHAMVGNYNVWKNKNASTYFDEAVRLARYVLEKSASSPNTRTQEAHEIIADVMEIRANMAWEKGEDARFYFERAIEAYRKALVPQPSAGLLNSLGVIFLGFARYLWDIGEPSHPYINEALKYQLQTLEIYAKNTIYLTNLAEIYYLRAEYRFEHRLNFLEDVNHASKTFRSILKINPSDAYSLLYFARLNLLQARIAKSRGTDPLPYVKEGLDRLRQAVKINEQFRAFAAITRLRLRIMEICSGSNAKRQSILKKIHQRIVSTLNDKAFIHRNGLLADLEAHACARQYGFALPHGDPFHRRIMNRFLALQKKDANNEVLKHYRDVFQAWALSSSRP